MLILIIIQYEVDLSLVFRETHLISTEKCHFISTRIPKFKKLHNTKT